MKKWELVEFFGGGPADQSCELCGRKIGATKVTVYTDHEGRWRHAVCQQNQTYTKHA